jgi:glutamine amidotransferase
LVLPGQGHFGQVMRSFEASGFEPLVRDHLAARRPFLGICVGLQLLMEGSEEAPGVDGLGLLAGRVRRFPAGGPSVPQMGWNRVRKVGDPALLGDLPDGFHAYFANSYWVDFDEPGLSGGRTRYGEVEFLSAVSRGAVHATQFHPEKSQRAGLRILRAFGRVARSATRAA